MLRTFRSQTLETQEGNVFETEYLTSCSFAFGLGKYLSLKHHASATDLRGDATIYRKLKKNLKQLLRPFEIFVRKKTRNTLIMLNLRRGFKKNNKTFV